MEEAGTWPAIGGLGIIGSVGVVGTPGCSAAARATPSVAGAGTLRPVESDEEVPTGAGGAPSRAAPLRESEALVRPALPGEIGAVAPSAAVDKPATFRAWTAAFGKLDAPGFAARLTGAAPTPLTIAVVPGMTIAGANAANGRVFGRALPAPEATVPGLGASTTVGRAASAALTGAADSIGESGALGSRFDRATPPGRSNRALTPAGSETPARVAGISGAPAFGTAGCAGPVA